jgi:hypothetical protein
MCESCYGYSLQTLTSVYSIVYKLAIMNIVMACIFEVISDKDKVCIYKGYLESNLHLFRKVM